MRVAIQATLIALLAASPALANEGNMTTEPTMPAKVPLTRIAMGNVDDMADEATGHLNRATFNLVDIKLHLRTKKASFRIGGGSSKSFQLRITGDAEAHGQTARLKLRFDAAAFGQRLYFDLPEFDVEPLTGQAGTGVAISVPLLTGEF